MSLWVDKYWPCSLDWPDYQEEQAAQLSNLVQFGDFPHLLIYGPLDAGKKCNNYVLHLKKIEISTVASNYHLEVNPSGIIDMVDKLRKDAQHALHRTMEKYMSTCRLILCCNSTSKICSVLYSVCKKEGLALPSKLAHRLAEKSCRNLRKALLMCEACRVQQYPFTEDQEIPETDWEVCQRETANATVSQQTHRGLSGRELTSGLLATDRASFERGKNCMLLEVRRRLYELLTHCIPPEMIMKGLLSELLHNCDGQLKGEVSQMAAYYEHRLQLGCKAIYHLEAFVAKFMALYKMFMEDGLEGMVF